MGLRRRVSYQWQLFIPLVITLWVMIIGMAFWQYNNVKQFKIEQLKEQLNLVNSRIISAYNSNINPLPFIKFVTRYFYDSPLYESLRVSVYVDGDLVHCYGEPISLTSDELSSETGFTKNPEQNDVGSRPMSVNERRSKENFFYSVGTNADGRMVVYTVVPFNDDVKAALVPSSNFFWLMFLAAVAMTILAYFSTRYFGKNIKILRSVAEQAVKDPNFIPPMDYPHDELGDITRQIVWLYNERSRALQRIEKEHAVAIHAIEEKAKSKRQLTNNINHELRTPIGVIKGYLDTIVENPDMDKESEMHFLRKAQEHVDRLVNLIGDVSAITRLEDGGELVNTEELNFHDLVFSLASDLEESGALGKMTFEFDIPLDCVVKGNFNLLTGMLINLSKNAASYSKGTKCEFLMTRQDDAFYHFAFHDDGVGVGDEHLPHLFDRFYRIDSGRSRKAGGTGLGLPIVQNTVIAHGGTIEVGHRADGHSGLEFRFTLPIYRN